MNIQAADLPLVGRDAQREGLQENGDDGIKNLYNLEPGFDGWKKAGKPVEK